MELKIEIERMTENIPGFQIHLTLIERHYTYLLIHSNGNTLFTKFRRQGTGPFPRGSFLAEYHSLTLFDGGGGG